ncbi:hypothetical protein [Lewinella sp. W8]|uniref:hypothetical protein n=1 Tax=Lewinella sp. W8 TaxID=2528208 RepID=UPI001068A5F1|nr:hypothetical protein [Lewinella sp. W8]MTB52816.1 hypothetical protein [Lewinella sp. W8]
MKKKLVDGLLALGLFSIIILLLLDVAEVYVLNDYLKAGLFLLNAVLILTVYFRSNRQRQIKEGRP